VDGASGGEAKLANVLKNAPEISAWGEAHGSILRYEGEPNFPGICEFPQELQDLLIYSTSTQSGLAKLVSTRDDALRPGCRSDDGGYTRHGKNCDKSKRCLTLRINQGV
jgi:hypothetical protein